MKLKQILSVIGFAALCMSMMPQTANAQNKQNRKVTIVSTTETGQISILSPDLDKVWKNSFRYVAVMPKNTTLKEYARAIDALKAPSVYTSKNTLVLCAPENVAQAKEAAEGYNVVPLNMSFTNKNNTTKVTFYTISKKKEGKYDYVLKELKDK